MKQWKGRFVAMFPAVTRSKTVLYAYRNCLIWRTLHNSACTKGLTIVFFFFYVHKRTQTPCSLEKRKNQHFTPFALSWSQNNKSRQESTSGQLSSRWRQCRNEVVWSTSGWCWCKGHTIRPRANGWTTPIGVATGHWLNVRTFLR